MKVVMGIWRESARAKGESGVATLPLCKKRNSAKPEKTSLSTDAF